MYKLLLHLTETQNSGLSFQPISHPSVIHCGISMPVLSYEICYVPHSQVKIRGIIWQLGSILYKHHVYCLTQNLSIQMASVDVKGLHSVCGLVPKGNRSIIGIILSQNNKRATYPGHWKLTRKLALWCIVDSDIESGNMHLIICFDRVKLGSFVIPWITYNRARKRHENNSWIVGMNIPCLKKIVHTRLLHVWKVAFSI